MHKQMLPQCCYGSAHVCVHLPIIGGFHRLDVVRPQRHRRSDARAMIRFIVSRISDTAGVQHRPRCRLEGHRSDGLAGCIGEPGGQRACEKWHDVNHASEPRRTSVHPNAIHVRCNLTTVSSSDITSSQGTTQSRWTGLPQTEPFWGWCL